MSFQRDRVGMEGLQFFGKISASISHEIKNVFAIINENAGLLDDYTVMAQKGMPIDPERLKKVAATINKQVHRADRIITRMNRFSHSVDDPVKTIDLNGVVTLVGSLAGRRARMKGVVLETVDAPVPVRITTYPFVLENLIWRCLDFSMAAMTGGDRLRLTVEPVENGATIRLTPEVQSARVLPEPIPSDTDKALARVLRAVLAKGADHRDLVITLPDDINA